MKGKIDQILVAVLDSRFSAITEEMGRSMLRTSRSPTFSEARDFATAIFTKDTRLIAQAEYLPSLACTVPVALENIAKTYEGDVNEGDIFIHNDVYSGNNHLPDVNIVKPVFYHGKLVFWAAVKGHMADIGGPVIGSYNPNAKTIWEEGLRIPACKLYERGERSRSVWGIIEKNVKVPDLVLGDIMCLVGGVTTGERRLIELLELYGKETIYAAINEIIAATERETRDKIRQIPDGIYYGEKAFDYNPKVRNRPYMVRVKVIKQGDEVTVDVSDSDPQVPFYLNSSWANTYSAVHLALFYILPGETKRNEGSLRPIKVIGRKGVMLNPEPPAPVVLCTATGFGWIVEAIILALANAVPHWVTAAHGSLYKVPYHGVNPRTKRAFANLDFLADAVPSGGTEGYDGWDIGGPTCTMGQQRSPDFEIEELVNPLHFIQHEQLMDSEGAGEFRGGFGHIYRCEYLAEGVGAVNGTGSNADTIPSGLFGGKSPKPAKVIIHRKDGTVEELPNFSLFTVKPGDKKEHYLMGSPGYGDPFRRDTEKVRQDVYDERVSIGRARDVYGVVIDPSTLKVDIKATEELRKRPKK